MYSIKHISIKYSIFLILLILAIPTKGQDIKGIVKDFIENYTPQHAKVAPSRLDKLQIDKEEKTISIYVSKGLQEQYYTDSIVESVYNALRDTLPESYKNYQLKIVADNKLIEELVPNILRNKDKIDNNRLSSVDYKGAPWMESQSKPYSIAKGLSGRHMVIWQSHGIYYTEKTNRWEWQRPRLSLLPVSLLKRKSRTASPFIRRIERWTR
jgi:hypothetical protein